MPSKVSIVPFVFSDGGNSTSVSSLEKLVKIHQQVKKQEGKESENENFKSSWSFGKKAQLQTLAPRTKIF